MSNFSIDSIDVSENGRLYIPFFFIFISTNFNVPFLLSFSIRLLNKNGWKFAPYKNKNKNEKPDIAVLSETWFNETSIDKHPRYKTLNFVRTKKNTWWNLNIL